MKDKLLLVKFLNLSLVKTRIKKKQKKLIKEYLNLGVVSLTVN